jgi:hypothetical protein
MLANSKLQGAAVVGQAERFADVAVTGMTGSEQFFGRVDPGEPDSSGTAPSRHCNHARNADAGVRGCCLGVAASQLPAPALILKSSPPRENRTGAAQTV